MQTLLSISALKINSIIMKTTAFVIAFFLLPPINFLEWQPSLYNGIFPDDAKVIFFDDFQNTDKSWKQSDHKLLNMSINAGNALLNAKKQEQFLWQELVMDRDGFELETRLSSPKGKADEPLTVLISGSRDRWLTFEVFPKGIFQVNLHNGGEVTALVETSPLNAIKKGANKLTVRKVDKTLYFFINEAFAASSPLPPNLGYRYGFIVNDKSEVNVDYFLMSDLVRSRRNADTYQEKGLLFIPKEERSRPKI
jgi:hypothetical protein